MYKTETSRKKQNVYDSRVEESFLDKTKYKQ